MSRYRTAGHFLLLCAVWGRRSWRRTSASQTFPRCRSPPCASTSPPRCCLPPLSPPARTSAPDSGRLCLRARRRCVHYRSPSRVSLRRPAVRHGRRRRRRSVGSRPRRDARAHASRLHRRGFTAATALGVALGFVGVVVIADPDPANITDSVLGVSLVLASALVFALSPRSSPTADRRRCRSSPRRRG